MLLNEAGKTSVVGVASEKVGDGDEDYCAKSCGCERVPESEAMNVEPREHPAADERTHEAENDVRDAAETAAARDLSR